eukprot:GHVR01069346.1.p1 GENE.GHVR01069346.1~~GHVR01069346.1.p1  ORF type:complete len:321 (+),score=28.07 GHVR01069346.1:29-964(+)
MQKIEKPSNRLLQLPTVHGKQGHPALSQFDDDATPLCTPFRIFLLIFLLIICIAVIVDSFCCHFLLHLTQIWTHWLSKSGVLGILCVALLRMCCIMLFIPSWPVVLSSAAAFTSEFGFWPGFILNIVLVFAADVVSMQMMFFIARYLLVRPMRRLMKRFTTVYWLDKAINHKGFRIALLIRLNPELTTLGSYFLGATSIKWRDYTIGTIGDLFGVIVYCYIAATIVSTRSSGGPHDGAYYLRVSAAVFAVVISLLLIVILAWAVKQEMNAIAIEERSKLTNIPENRSGIASDDGRSVAVMAYAEDIAPLLL